MNDKEISELRSLRKRVKAQRAELRRLNKIVGTRWAAFSAGLYAAKMAELRHKMIKAFGYQAVHKAEYGGNCDVRGEYNRNSATEHHLNIR